MSIYQTVQDAVFLWNSGKRESAMLLAVVAVAATAKKENPNARNQDREIFESVAKRIRPYSLLIHYRGTERPIEELLYKWLRCFLVHEAEWPIDIEFVPNPAPGQSSVRAGSNEGTLQLSESWFHDILYIVTSAPINEDEFKSISGK